MSDEPLTTCEVCGAKASRVLFAPAIHFKGTGFHNTDYGSASAAAVGDDGGGASATSDSGSGTAPRAAPTRRKGASKPAESSGAKKTVGLDKV